MDITIYTRPGCHLCDEMKAVVERVAGPAGIAVEEIDISRDPSLESLYGEQIPVLMVDGTKTAKYRVSEADVRRMIGARSGG